MKFTNARSVLTAFFAIIGLSSCDKPASPDGNTSPKLEAKHPAPVGKPTSLPANEPTTPSLNRPSESEQVKARITQMLSKATNPKLPRAERIAVLDEIAATEGEASTIALVALISMKASDEEEHSIASTGPMASIYPAIKAIRSRGKAAVPSMCEQILILTANGGDSSDDLRLICMTALTTESLETIHRQLTAAAQKKGYSALVLDKARSLVESFAKGLPTRNR